MTTCYPKIALLAAAVLLTAARTTPPCLSCAIRSPR